MFNIVLSAGDAELAWKAEYSGAGTIQTKPAILKQKHPRDMYVCVCVCVCAFFEYIRLIFDSLTYILLFHKINESTSLSFFPKSFWTSPNETQRYSSKEGNIIEIETTI